MIIIGEKINGAVPSVGKAIANRDSDFIKNLARIQAEANSDYIDCCASVLESEEMDTLEWLIDNIQEVTDLPISIDSPNPHACVGAMKFCNRPGIINSVSMEGDKIDVVFSEIADTEWECVALLSGDAGIPKSVEERLEIFEQIMDKAEEYGIDPSRLYIDPLVVTLATDQEALLTFAETSRGIKERYPDVRVISGLSNISYGLPKRNYVDKAFLSLAMQAGMDSAILDPTASGIQGAIYATNALLNRDKHCMGYIRAHRGGLLR